MSSLFPLPPESQQPGMLLLSGGAGSRMGAPKHALDHPAGGSWGGHLVRVFGSVFPGAPVLVLGDPLPDHPELPRLDDPREGPAVALRTWAMAAAPPAGRWWVVACDQVRWTPGRLARWAAISEAADPAAARWVMALHGGHLQPLGGWIPEALRPALAASSARSLMALAASLPHLALPREGPEWADVDTPEERDAFENQGPSGI
ncbi:MAG: NTP transferase domain-containing protein [Geothrix sp.]|nr:NTP transferase domain-containing protein [Geothrix sp.]